MNEARVRAKRRSAVFRVVRALPAIVEALFGGDADTVVRQIAAIGDSTDWAVLEAAAQCRERLRQS